MIKIFKTAKSLQDGIDNMMAGAKEDYAQTMGRNDSAYTKQKLENYESQTTVKEGKKYIKVIYDRSVFALSSGRGHFTCKMKTIFNFFFNIVKLVSVYLVLVFGSLFVLYLTIYLI